MGQFIAPKATTTQRLTIIPDQGELIFDTTVNKLYGGDGSTTGGFLIGNGDVSGPSSSVNNRVVFFDGTTGKLIKDSGLTLSGTNTGDQTITLTGDVTGSGTGSFATTLATQAGVTTGTYNSATQITPITIDAKGRITNTGTTVTIAPLFSSIASKPTTLSGYGITDALSTSSTTSALTSFGSSPNLNNPLLTSISTVGGGGLEGGQINFARVTDGTGYWFIDSYGSTASPDLRIVESATERFKFGAGGAFYVGGSAGTSGQVLTSAGTSASPTWTSVFTNPMTTAGDIIYGGTSGAATRLAGSGTNGWVLTYDTTLNAPKWAASSGGGGMSIGGSITSATAGSILFADTSGVLAQDNSNFFWDNTNKRLGIGTATPGSSLHCITPSGTQQFAIILGTNTSTAAAAFSCINLSATFSPTTTSAASYRTLNMTSTYNAPGINFTGIFGNNNGTLYVENRITSTGTITSLTGAYFVGMLCASQAVALGTVTTVAGTYTRAISSFSNSLTSTVTNAYGSYIAASTKLTLTITSEVGQAIEEITAGTNNTNLLLGTGTIPTGSWSIYNSSTRANYLAGNVLLNTTSNSGYRLDVNGTGRYQNTLTTTGRVHAYSRKTSAYTLLTTDEIIFGDTTTAGFTLTLPAPLAGIQYTIMKFDSTTNVLTVNPATGSQRINGATSWTANTQYKYITIVSDGSNWFIVAGN